MNPPPLIPSQAVVEQTLEEALKVVTPNFHMGLDLALAVIPLIAAVLLFRMPSGKIPGVLWWLLFLIFSAFLPNAPYVLTDVIHFEEKIRVTPPLPVWATSLLMVEFFLHFWIGLQCFTLSLMFWGGSLRARGFGWLVLPVEILSIAFSAFGMYLGRIDRLNSWYFVTKPQLVLDRSVNDLFARKPEELTLVFLAALLILYYAAKLTNLLIARVLAHPLYGRLPAVPGVEGVQAPHVHGHHHQTFDLKPIRSGGRISADRGHDSAGEPV